MLNYPDNISERLQDDFLSVGIEATMPLRHGCSEHPEPCYHTEDRIDIPSEHIRLILEAAIRRGWRRPWGKEQTNANHD